MVIRVVLQSEKEMRKFSSFTDWIQNIEGVVSVEEEKGQSPYVFDYYVRVIYNRDDLLTVLKAFDFRTRLFILSDRESRIHRRRRVAYQKEASQSGRTKKTASLWKNSLVVCSGSWTKDYLIISHTTCGSFFCRIGWCKRKVKGYADSNDRRL